MASPTKSQSPAFCTSPQEETSSSGMFAHADRFEHMHTVQEGTDTRCESAKINDEARPQFGLPHPEDKSPNSLSNFCTTDNSSQVAENKLTVSNTTKADCVELNADDSSVPNFGDICSFGAEVQDEKNGFPDNSHSPRTCEEIGMCEQRDDVAYGVAQNESDSGKQVDEHGDNSQNSLDAGVDKVEGCELEKSAICKNDEDNTQGSASSVSEHDDENEENHVAKAASANVTEEQETAGTGVEQHSLTGPHRIHHMARRQRIQDANAVVPPLPPRRRTISLPESLRTQWRAIGAQWGLQDDNAIANMLLRHYEDLMAGRPPRPPPRPRCQDCGEVLVPAPCLNCGPNHHSNRLAHHRHDNDPGGGRNNFCGRCRD